MARHALQPRAISAAEAALRRDLAACYRLAAMYRWDDLLSTHFSARLPGEDAFLINPYGMMFEEITASSLVKVDADGNILDDTPYSVNRAGFVIHSAVHEARPDAGCVMHLHTRDGVAVSATQAGILPLNQSAMLIHQDIAFHDYEGVATNIEERARLARDLGPTKSLMLLRNHGTLSLGPTIADAFSAMYFLERACTVQVRTLGMGIPIHEADGAAIASVSAQRKPGGSSHARDLVWPALIRKVEREQPGFDA